MSPLPDWSALIRQRRQATNLSQRELALRLGIDQKTVSRWERGQHRPGDEMKLRIAEQLGCTPEELFPWSDTVERVA